VNGAGDGGAGQSLPTPGQYVVVVEAVNPTVRWSVGIDDADNG
jgi:hypothetical protein